MNTDLITAAEAALFELKCAHRALECPMPDNCPTSRAIAGLEVEIAKAKRSQDITIEIPNSPQDWEPEATYGGGVKVEEMDDHDVADAILRAHPRQFMPSAHRLCVACDSILPPDTQLGKMRCHRCE